MPRDYPRVSQAEYGRRVNEDEVEFLPQPGKDTCKTLRLQQTLEQLSGTASRHYPDSGLRVLSNYIM
jgi:hypothetical protein